MTTEVGPDEDGPGEAASHRQPRPGGALALADAADRLAVARQLDDTLFVEAGAGTGKTHALVERLVGLVTRGGLHLSGIAAITFTEAAAAELRARVRERLTSLAEEQPHDRAVLAALGELDEAAITTIHGFAQRLLGEHLLEAGLPLRLRVLDEVAADLALEARFEAFLDGLFDEPDAQLLLTAARAVGVGTRELRLLARQVEESWHRHRPSPPPGPGAITERVVRGCAAVRGALATALAFAPHCRVPEDALLARLADLWQAAGAGEAVGGDWLAQLRWLVGLPALRAGKLGRKQHWGCDLAEVRAALAGYEDARRAALEGVHELVLRAVLDRLGEAAQAAAAARRSTGELVFHDLLVCCRDLLRDRPEARQAARRRWARVLVDEFQDTDALQYEILRLLGAPPGEASLEPGRLFFVGDPKQAIYRFRGADVALYEQARAELATGGGQRARLATSFRSLPGVCHFVNGCFGQLLGEPGRPAEVQLSPARPHRPGVSAVQVLGGPLPRGRAAARREREAGELAAVLRRVVAEGWPVGEGAGRPARYGDVALLVPRRTGLAVLEGALEAAGVPYRVASSTLLYASSEVRDLLAGLRVLVQPGEERAVVAALRTPAFACGDDQLLQYREAGGRWRLDAPVPSGLAGHPVVQALAALASLAERRHRLGVVGTVEALVAERRLHQLACATRRPPEAWRRIEFVLGQARAFARAGGNDLAGFLRWAERQGEAGVFAVEPAPAEEDADAVTILTVHGAKGLEFPVVALAELGARPRPLSGPTLLFGEGDRPELRVRLGLATAGFAGLAEVEAEASRREQLRLCYVAATRARDHLLLSLYHEPAATPAAATPAELLFQACQEVPERWQALTPDPPASPAGGAAGAPGAGSQLPQPGPGATLAGYEAWRERRARLLARGRLPAALAPSELAPGSPPSTGATGAVPRRHAAPGAPRESEGSEPAVAARRAATALGRAVHAVLQGVDLASGEGLETLAAGSAAAEGCPDRAGEVAELARTALAAPVVRAAVASGRPRREVPVVVPLAGGLVDGVVDLLFEEAGRLVVVDYKTDALATADQVPAAAERYRLQLGAYALALEAGTGLAVDRCVLVFLAPPDGAVEHELAGEQLRRLAGQARTLLAGRFALAQDLDDRQAPPT